AESMPAGWLDRRGESWSPCLDGIVAPSGRASESGLLFHDWPADLPRARLTRRHNSSTGWTRPTVIRFRRSIGRGVAAALSGTAKDGGADGGVGGELVAWPSGHRTRRCRR